MREPTGPPLFIASKEVFCSTTSLLLLTVEQIVPHLSNYFSLWMTFFHNPPRKSKCLTFFNGIYVVTRIEKKVLFPLSFSSRKSLYFVQHRLHSTTLWNFFVKHPAYPASLWNFLSNNSFFFDLCGVLLSNLLHVMPFSCMSLASCLSNIYNGLIKKGGSIWTHN